MTAIKKQRHPLFDLLDARGVRYSWLARTLGYSVAHVHNISARIYEPGPKFRRKCAELLGMPESALFLTRSESTNHLTLNGSVAPNSNASPTPEV